MTNIEISIIIATRNRESILWESVGKALAAIENQKAEIIIVNDGDRELSIPFHFSGNIKVLNNFKRGVSKARNIGAENAKGIILFFVDDDMWINTEIIKWIEKNLINEKKEDAVYNVNWEYPPELNAKLKETKVGRFILANEYNTMWGRMHQKDKKPGLGLYDYNSVGSCSLVISKKIFEKIEGYMEPISFQGEDINLGQKLNKNNIKIYCLFDVTLFHNHRDRLEINEYLSRIERGYRSQFSGERNNWISTSKFSFRASKTKTFIYRILLMTESLWIKTFNIIPNTNLLTPFSNRIINILSGLVKYKQWKETYES